MQPSQIPQPPAAPAPLVVQGAPIQGAGGAAATAVQGTPVPPIIPGVPRTRAEVSAIQAARESLSDQMQSAQGRRDEIVEQLKGATGVDRAGLENRLAVTDARLAQLEADLATTGRQLAAAPAELVTSTSTAAPWYERMDNVNVTAVSTVFSIFVLAPIALSFARLIWRRGSRPMAPAIPSDTGQRLERMEQAIDAIAVEVERISEGQRFVTRLLGESNGLQSLGRAQQAETIPVSRGGL